MEARIAKFLGKEAALLFSTGYQTGQGVISSLVSRGEYILSDKDNHASIVAGNQLAASKNITVLRYKHNDMADLKRRLQQLEPGSNALVATDGVFSTFGTIVELDRVTQLCKHYGANLIVDDAHAFGVIGEGGKGTGHHFGVEDDVDLIICTLVKHWPP